VHLPWCVRKCPYCDFNSHAARAELPFADYIAALIRDLEQELPLVWGRVIQSVFFGGGTPSLFAAEYIDQFLQAAAARLHFSPNLEITLEVNPGTSEYDRFARYRAAGVNRLSFGVQSFDDTMLQTLGRIHNGHEAIRALKQAQDNGFDNINLDLMFALPQQTIIQAENDLLQAFALQPTHISWYQLTLEQNTVFFSRPPVGILDDDAAYEIQEHGQNLLKEAGYLQYEVSAYAQAGYQCIHNLNYWRFGDYLGIGAGAHGKISEGAKQQIRRRWKHKHPRTYMETAGTPACIGGDEIITSKHLPFEYMLNVLRLHEGFDLRDFESATGLPRAVLQPGLIRGVQCGGLLVDGNRVMPTEQGRRFANSLMELFLD